MTLEVQYTLTGEQLTDLAYQIAGATAAVFLVKDPQIDLEAIAEEVKSAALITVAQFPFKKVESV